MTITVVAHKKGHYLVERQVGDEFEFPVDALKKDQAGNNIFPSWFAPADIAQPLVAKHRAEEARKLGQDSPRTRSEMAKVTKPKKGDDGIGDLG